MLDTTGKKSLASVARKAEHRRKGPAALSFILGSLRSGRRLVGISAVSFLAIGLLYVALRPRSYTASTEFLVYVKEIQTGADLAILPGRADLPLVLNQIELIRSGNVLTKVLKSLEGSADVAAAPRVAALPDMDSARPTQENSAAFISALEELRRKLTVGQIGTSHLVRVAYKATNPELAARVLDTVALIYFQELARGSDAAAFNATAHRELYQGLGPSAFLVSPVQLPTAPDGPPAAWIVLGAALLGLCAGAAAAILREALNDAIRSAGQVDYALGMDCLAVIPEGAAAAAGDLTAPEPYAPPRGQLRNLTASLREASLRGVRIVGVTSAMPGEGASTIAIGLARAVAASGKRALLIDGVSGGGSISRWAENSRRVAAGMSPDLTPGGFDALVEPEPGLRVLTRKAGSDAHALPQRPADADASLPGAAGSFDMVIVDLPALAAGPHVRSTALWMDGYLLVVKWGATQSELVRQALRSDGEARPKFLGAILNMADEQEMALFGYAPAPAPKLATG